MTDDTLKEILDEVYSDLKNELASLEKEVIKSTVEKITKEKITQITNEVIEKYGINLKDLIQNNMEKIKSRALPTEYVDLNSKESSDIFPKDIEKIITDLLVGNNVYFYGYAGTGKTYVAKAIAKQLLGVSYYIITCSQWTSPTNIIGGQTITGYKQGNLIKAWRYGGVLVLDELPKLEPNSAGLLNEALAETGDKAKMTKAFFSGKLKVGTKVYLGSDKDSATLDYTEFITFEFPKEDKNGNVVDTPIKYYIKIIDGVVNEIQTVSDNNYSGGYNLIENELTEDYIKDDSEVAVLPTITDGNGAKQPKNHKFYVIATGNTNLKEQSTNYGGNNKQDYSLVDRFAGSFYKVIENREAEQKINYGLVYHISDLFRKFLISQTGAEESISMRTMLNFSRVYEVQMLSLISKDKYWSSFENIKTLSDSIKSFVESFGSEATIKEYGEKLETQIEKLIHAPDDKDKVVFIFDYWRMTGKNAINNKPIVFDDCIKEISEILFLEHDETISELVKIYETYHMEVIIDEYFILSENNETKI